MKINTNKYSDYPIITKAKAEEGDLVLPVNINSNEATESFFLDEVFNLKPSIVTYNLHEWGKSSVYPFNHMGNNKRLYLIESSNKSKEKVKNNIILDKDFEGLASYIIKEFNDNLGLNYKLNGIRFTGDNLDFGQIDSYPESGFIQVSHQIKHKSSLIEAEEVWEKTHIPSSWIIGRVYLKDSVEDQYQSIMRMVSEIKAQVRNNLDPCLRS